MESATTIYKNGNELHTQPTRVQFHTLQSYALQRLGPQRSTHPHPVERTWRNTDRSLRVRVLKSFFQQSPEQLILSKTYPTSGYNLAHVFRHARLLAGGYFAEKRLM